jgi:rod shape-determining protein MreD
MSILAPAVGAAVTAILESSALAHLQMGGVKPDLVFAVGVAVAMVLGFEAGVTWAFVGGVMLDLLIPGRALGSTTLVLLLVTAMALTVARAMWPPRLVIVAITVFVLSVAFQVLLLSVLAVTVDVAFAGLSVGELLLSALLNVLVAALSVVAIRALDQRFGEPERLAW